MLKAGRRGLSRRIKFNGGISRWREKGGRRNLARPAQPVRSPKRATTHIDLEIPRSQTSRHEGQPHFQRLLAGIGYDHRGMLRRSPPPLVPTGLFSVSLATSKPQLHRLRRDRRARAG